MRKTHEVLGSRRNLLLRAAGLAVIAAPILFGLASAAPSRAQSQSQTQNTAGTAQTETLPAWSDPEYAKFVYSVVSIKPFKGDANEGRSLGTRDTPDGYSAAFPVEGLIYEAYRTEHYRVSGGSGWMESEMYSVEAKMDPDVMEALQKLSPEKRRVARQHMLQVLLQEYFKTVVHTEIRQVPAYDLVIAKGGPKLKESPAFTGPGIGMRNMASGGTRTVEFKGVEIGHLVTFISNTTGRPVYDKTELTGTYEITLRFAADSLAASAPGEPPAESDAPPLKKALEEQLGLKLVSAMGPMEYIIIDHAERPAGN